MPWISRNAEGDVNGVFTFSNGDASREELAEGHADLLVWETRTHWLELRFERDDLLNQTDNRMLADAPSGRDNAAWRAYRQALRDLPENTVDPLNPTWPTKP
tara:strand:+ start:201 stop:506 length:306 start_codon:yes stop_codon:yes gene_type:complete